MPERNLIDFQGVDITRVSRGFFTNGAALVLPLLAIGVTVEVSVFNRIPWTLSLFCIAVVAWIAGFVPALIATLIAGCGVYRLILVPPPHSLYDPPSLVQTAAFAAVASLIAFLVRQRKLAVSSLLASELHYRSVTETASDVIVTIDSHSQILSINPAVKTIFGYEPEELLGKRLPVLMPEKYRASHEAGIARHVATGLRNIPWTGVQLPGLRKDGKEIPLEISFASHIADGEERFTGFIRDVSELRNAQATLMQSEKLAAVGRLSSSIAHEINNPLEALTNLLYLSRTSKDLAEAESFLETAERELGRIAVIANRTLEFHKQSTAPEAANPVELIDSCLTLYQGRLINSRIAVQQRARAQQEVVCMKGEIRQVLNNLIGNAIDALPRRGGRILIRSRDATDWKTQRTGVAFTVADNGTGMSAETKKRIFEPFFSTKGDGGAGLGLWISSEIVERNQGRLRVRSSQMNGRSGTVFTLFLPSDLTDS